MKTLKLPAAMIGLTALLTACPQPPTPEPVPPAPSKVSLTLTLTGPSAAPVKVTNTTTNIVLNDGAISSGKIFGDLTAGTVLKVEPGNVDGFTTPSAQTVTLDASKTITLEYKTLPGSAVQATRVAGTVTGAPAAATRAVLISGNDYDFTNTGTVKGGVLDLPLTKAPDSKRMFSLTSGGGCTFTGSQTSNPSVALFTDLELFSEKIDSLAFATEQIVSGGTVPGSLVARLYSAAAATVKGTVLCTNPDGSKFTAALDVVLDAGWNAVEYAGTNSTLTLRSLGGGVRSEIKATAYTPSVLVSLGSEVKITSDAGVSVPARLYQEGGYTGQVSLSTDVPGLTIEPSTVNLTATTLQSVQAQATAAYLKNLGVNPQRLDTDLTFKYSGQENFSGPFSVIVKDTTGKQVGGGYGSLEVRKPGLTVGTCGSSSLELYPNSTAALNVCGSSVGNFSGPVTYSATGLPAGVSVTPVTQTLNGYSYLSLTFKSDATLKPGTYPITLTADGGTVKASASTELKVPAPTVNVAISAYYGQQQIYQGGTAQMNVDVSTQNGFNGQTTLNVTGLPAGVTAAPKTVTVTPGSTTTAAITLTATADATLGNTAIKVTSPDQSSNSSGAETQLMVRPARTSLGTTVGAAVTAASGLWTVTATAYDSNSNAYRNTVTRFTGTGQSAASALVVSQNNLQLIRTAGGVIAFDNGFGKAPVLIADDGAVTELPAVNLSTLTAFTRTTDSQGRVWFVQNVSTGMGGSATSLKTWVPVTGVVTTVDTSANYGSSAYDAPLNLGADGKTLVYLGGYSGDVLKIDTATGTVTKLDLLKSSGATSAAVAADGTVWFSANGQLARLNADNTVNKFTNVQAGTLIGFDQNNPAVLWGSDYSNVYRIDTAANTSTSINLGSVSRALLNVQSGVQVITNEYNGNATNYYLSQLK